MKRSLLSSLLVVFSLCVLVFTGNGSALASSVSTSQIRKPMLNCNQCESRWWFNHASGINGMSLFYDSFGNVPNLTSCTGCFWGTYIAVTGSGNLRNKSALIVGVEEFTNGLGYCGSYSGHLIWVAYAFDQYGVDVDNLCIAVNQTGNEALWMGSYVSGGGGMQLVVQNRSETQTFFKLDVPWSYGIDRTYYNMYAWEQYVKNNVGNDELLSLLDVYQYYKNGIWNLQTGNQSGSSIGNPPQWYWFYPPSSGNGGVQYHCIKPSGTTC